MRSRNRDDPKKIGLWKLGRTIGTGSSGEHIARSRRVYVNRS